MGFDLPVLKGMLKNDVNETAQDLIIAGFISSALGEPYQYDSDQHDQLNLIGAASLGTTIAYRSRRLSDGIEDYFAHTAMQLKQVLADGAARKLSILQAAKSGRDAIDAAVDETSIQTAADDAIKIIQSL